MKPTKLVVKILRLRIEVEYEYFLLLFTDPVKILKIKKIYTVRAVYSLPIINYVSTLFLENAI